MSKKNNSWTNSNIYSTIIDLLKERLFKRTYSLGNLKPKVWGKPSFQKRNNQNALFWLTTFTNRKYFRIFLYKKPYIRDYFYKAMCVPNCMKINKKMRPIERKYIYKKLYRYIFKVLKNYSKHM